MAEDIATTVISGVINGVFLIVTTRMGVSALLKVEAMKQTMAKESGDDSAIQTALVCFPQCKNGSELLLDEAEQIKEKLAELDKDEEDSLKLLKRDCIRMTLPAFGILAFNVFLLWVFFGAKGPVTRIDIFNIVAAYCSVIGALTMLAMCYMFFILLSIFNRSEISIYRALWCLLIKARP